MPRRTQLSLFHQVEIPVMDWEQIDGDMDPGAHGGTIARGDGYGLDLLKIQPVREYVRDREAAEVGYPFWTREASFTADDLDPSKKEVRSAMESVGLDDEALKGMEPTVRALALASAMLDYGYADEGPHGWSADIIHQPVKWWNGKVEGAEYLADEDEEFRNTVLGYDDIRTALEEAVDRMADDSSATAWSTPGDQIVGDLEDEGYDPESVVGVAEFGDAVAVNGDLTDKTLAQVEAELEAEGYEDTGKGGDIPSDEAEVQTDHAVSAVARQLNRSEEDVNAAAQSIDGWGDLVYRSTSGDGSIWAKRLGVESEGDEGAGDVEERRRRGPQTLAVRSAGSAQTYSGADIARMHDEIHHHHRATVKGIRVEVKTTPGRKTAGKRYDRWDLYIDGKQVWSGQADSIDPLNIPGGTIEAFVLQALHQAGIERAGGESVREARHHPAAVSDPFYVIQGLYNSGYGAGGDFGYDDEQVAIDEAEKLARSGHFEGDYVRIITRDGELVWDSRRGRRTHEPRAPARLPAHPQPIHRRRPQRLQRAHARRLNPAADRPRALSAARPPPHALALASSDVYFQPGERLRIRSRGPQGQPFEAFWFTVPSAMTAGEVALQFAQTGQPGMLIDVVSGTLTYTYRQGRHAGLPTVTRVPVSRRRRRR